MGANTIPILTVEGRDSKRSGMLPKAGWLGITQGGLGTEVGTEQNHPDLQSGALSYSPAVPLLGKK